MLSLEECRTALGSLADHKSDAEIARMREQAATFARIVIRTYFGSGAATSPGGAALPADVTQDSLVEQDHRSKPEGHKGRRRRGLAGRRPVGQMDSSRGERLLRGQDTMQS
jgi:hypothetical protein